MLDGLKYQAPELVTEALFAATPGDGSIGEVLDAGCGTGLCGPLVRSRAGQLTGMDLSPKMLDRARQRGVYDDLVEAELTAYMADAGGRYDAIVCADTLVYFGRLDEAMAAAREALAPGGVFVFTVEHWGDAGPDDRFRLEPTGRYVHGQPYVEDCVRAAQLTVSATTHATLRMETGKPVAGLVVTAVRPKT